MTEREEKIARIHVLLDQLYCFTPEEIEEFRRKTDVMRDDGLDPFIELLTNGKKQQDEFFARRIEENKSYPKEMAKFLHKVTKNLKDKYEAGEKEEAEEILKDIV